ncbi:MAG: thioredoxin domain-containing protein [Candidatus Acidiferrales bacterium]
MGIAVLLALLSTSSNVCHARPMQAPSEPRQPGEPNRLIHEDSPYLQSAARQPVDWYPFGPEAFERARQLDRPILLDIGAVWCHWCHVMDRESYENPEIAGLINDMFVAIKVDRDARPDIDIRYQRTVSALTGQGGWPLTAFLTPDGKVFFGGTYFPPESRLGRPGLKQLLPQVSDAYRTNKDRVLAAADSIAQRLQAFESGSIEPGEVTPALLEKLVDAVRKDFDPEFGGPPGAPKFPHGAILQLALDRHFATRDPKLFQVAEKTLDAMAQGGIRDYVHGGFYRYSTDRFWHIPHFEKMAYVQAELLAAYAAAYQFTGKPLYREAARETVAYLTDTLSNQAQGGFYATQDADLSLDDDGTYYTWTLAEIHKLLTPEEARAFAACYGIEATPKRHPPATPDRNVPYLARPMEAVAAEMELPAERVRNLLDSARQKLRAVRRSQKAPFVDRTVFIDWNALLLSAYSQAYQAFGEESVREFALRTADFLLEKAYRRGQGMRHALVGGEPRTAGLLADQVYMALALEDLYEISGRQRYLDAAQDLLDFTLKNFWDPERGGFFDVAHGEDFVEVLAQPRKELQDAPLPGQNSIAALALDRLAALTGDARYRKKAEETLAAFAGSAPNLGTFAATYARAVDFHLSSPMRVVVVGDQKDPRVRELRRSALATFRPHKTVLLHDPKERQGPPLPAGLDANDLRAQEPPRSFICLDTACSSGISDAARLAELIRNFDTARGAGAKGSPNQ